MAPPIQYLRMLDTKGNNPGVSNRVSENCKCEEDALIGTVEDVAAKLVGKPTRTVLKKIEEEKKLADEKKKTDEVEQKRVTEEKKKADMIERQRIAAETEKSKMDKGKITIDAEQKQKTEQEKLKAEADRSRVRNLLYKTGPTTDDQKRITDGSKMAQQQTKKKSDLEELRLEEETKETKEIDKEKLKAEEDRNRVRKLLYKGL